MVFMPDILQALKSNFGHDSFIPPQDRVIEDILAGRDVFVSMPTGGGKSLCYQLPALIMEGTALIISPLIALMKDQVDGLKARNINAACINSSMSFEEISALKSDLVSGKVRLLYLAPERLMLREFLMFLKSLKISLIAIDEAHCVSEWGHDFRPAYRNLKLLREHFPEVPIMALTATAIPEVQRDIIRQLSLADPKVHKTSFNRPNLFYQVKPRKDAYEQLLHYLRENRDKSGIVYCRSRSSADSLSKRLADDGCSILPFHAGLDPIIKTHTQDSFIKGGVKVIVATIAFGMGIDKPDIRFVIHYDLPKDLETYYQETGRAGRDGERSDCILLYSSADARKIGYLLEKKGDERQRWVAKRKLEEMIGFCESRICRRRALLEYFKEPYENPNCGNCDNCIESDRAGQELDRLRKILCCVSELKECWGTGRVVDVLRGSKSQSVIAKDHHLLGSYGKGLDVSAREWRSIISQLISAGYLSKVGERYPVLKLTEKGLDVIEGEEVIDISVQSSNPCLVPDEELFEELKRLRWRMAQDQKVPPYLIFHDSSLRAMAANRPRTLSQFCQISGVGAVKLERYGDIFVKEIEDHCMKNGLKPVSPGPSGAVPGRDYKPIAIEEFESWFHEYNSWSFTKHKIWSRCRRAYYYSYIKIGLKELSQSDKQMFRDLKDLKPKAALQGMLIHKVIENQIELHRSGQAMSEQAAAQEYSELIDQYRINPERTITEFHNHQPVDESFFDGILAGGKSLIETFFKLVWPKLEPCEYIAHEKLNNFQIDGTSVSIKLDYLSRAPDGCLVLSDWKTGRGDGRYESEVQIGSYVLWAIDRFKIKPEEVRSRLVYLKDGSMKEYAFSAESLEEIKATIQENFEEMNRTAEIDYFYPDPHPSRCMSCQFSTVCGSSACAGQPQAREERKDMQSEDMQSEAGAIRAQISDLARRLSELEGRCAVCDKRLV